MQARTALLWGQNCLHLLVATSCKLQPKVKRYTKTLDQDVILHRTQKCLGYEVRAGATHVFRTGRGKLVLEVRDTPPSFFILPSLGSSALLLSAACWTTFFVAHCKGKCDTRASSTRCGVGVDYRNPLLGIMVIIWLAKLD
jgi:hypothetical protein